VIFPVSAFRICCALRTVLFAPGWGDSFSYLAAALHVNYPLEELAADKPLQVKNQILDEWIKERWRTKAYAITPKPPICSMNKRTVRRLSIH